MEECKGGAHELPVAPAKGNEREEMIRLRAMGIEAFGIGEVLGQSMGHVGRDHEIGSDLEDVSLVLKRLVYNLTHEREKRRMKPQSLHYEALRDRKLSQCREGKVFTVAVNLVDFFDDFALVLWMSREFEAGPGGGV